MAHGREVRLPFLNNELVQFIFSLPSGYKIRKGLHKYILRKLMDDKLPRLILYGEQIRLDMNLRKNNGWKTRNMKDYLYEAKNKLVKEDFLKPHVLAKKKKSHHAHDADNYRLAILVHARMIA